MVSRSLMIILSSLVLLLSASCPSLSAAIEKSAVSSSGSRWSRLFNRTKWINRIARRISPVISSAGNKIKTMRPKPLTKGVNHHPEAYLTATQIITYRGYTAQTYTVTTDDGYILELHRIPYSKTASSTTGRPIFLQHGFLDSSADWLISPSASSLAFRLADLGYDVWLGNARGNTYSRKHTSLNPSQETYWHFSYDEMGKYDIPAVINFIINTTGKSKLLYVGHSMGCAMFFIAMTYHPELNSKIELMFALGPAANLNNMRSPIRFATPFVNQIQFLFWLLRVRVLLDNNAPLPTIQRRFCEFNMQAEILCRSSILSVVGDDANDMPLDLLPVIAHHNPAGVSIRTAAQFAQNHNAGETFQPYDFGWWGNYVRYGQIRPPAYDLSKVTCPVYLFYGPNDLLVVPEDVAWLASKLPNVKASIGVDYSTYNHFDFLWATDNNRLLYDQLIGLLPSPTSL